MKESDLLISQHDGIYSVKVTGRANFEYAVPLRELAKSSSEFKCLRIDLEDCVAMDSTFMGVLSMIGLKSRRCNAAVELLNANDTLKKLLRDLGVSKLFAFTEGTDPDAPQWSAADGSAPRNDMLTTAETVTEAHQTLVEVDSGNAARFDQVIEFARQDVERLRNREKED